MDDDLDQAGETRAQAAEWFARLKNVPVSRETLEQFFEWRKVDSNAAAFETVERFWTQAGEVGLSPEIAAATRAAYARGRGQPRSRLASPWIWGALAAALLACATVVILGWGRGTSTYATHTGERSEVLLEDGSKLTLDTNTKVVVHYSSDARHIRLDRGQAYFEVAHATDRPFTVAAAETKVVATGTEFQVRRVGDGAQITLLKGRVLVTPSSNEEATALNPGQRIDIRRGAIAQLRPVDTGSITAWKRGQLVLDDMTLAEAVAEINRYTDRPIELDSPRYANSRLSGSLAIGDTSSFAVAAAALLPVVAEHGQNGGIRLVDRSTDEKK